MTASSRRLTYARDFVAKPGGWTQHALGRDDAGIMLSAADMGLAVCACAAGAIFVASIPGPDVEARGEARRQDALLLRRAVCARWGDVGPGLSSWNDAPERTQEDVVAAFDDAIELARAEETT